MTEKFVTLPREVVEQVMNSLRLGVAMYPNGGTAGLTINEAINALRAALEHPQNHVPDAENMAPAGWKLVPSDATHQWTENLADRGMRISSLASAISDMLAAAPQPPTVKECLTVEQPQANQPAMTPIAQRKLDSLMASGYTISGYSVYHERKPQHGFVTGAGLVGWWKPEGMEYPQPQGEQEPVAEHELKDVRCECCGYMTHHREHMGCIRAAQSKREPLSTARIDELIEEGIFGGNPYELVRRLEEERGVFMTRPLTDGVIKGIHGAIKWHEFGSWLAFARAIEATHNIK